MWARTRVHKRQGWWNLWGGRQTASVDYVIELPRQSQVEVSSVSAPVDVSSIEGQVTIDSVSGSVAVRHVEGPLHLKSVSGRVNGQALLGQLHLETISGRVDLADSDFSLLRVRNVSGSLKIATNLQPTGEYRVYTVSGNVELIVPATTNCTVEGHSTSGRLRTTLAHTSERQRFGTWRIEVGADVASLKGSPSGLGQSGGGVPLRFHSVSGDLILTVAEESAAVEPAGGESGEMVPKAEPEITLSTLDILKAIEAGQLSVEEGVARLKELKGGMEEQYGD